MMASHNNNTNNNNKSEIYENLPCDRRRVKSGEVGGGDGTPTAIVPPHTKAGKESLYATPLRKSDRQKSSTGTASSRTEKSGGGERRNNTNQSNKSRKSVEKVPAAGIPNQDPILEQRRMRNFLKDQPAPVTPSHKSKIDAAAQMNANFSALAQEEHFANLVHQNVLVNNVQDNREGEEKEKEKELINSEEREISTNEGNVVTNESEEIPLNGEEEEEETTINPADETMTVEELEDKCLRNLELLTQKAAAAVEQESRRQLEENGGGIDGLDQLEKAEAVFMLPANRLEIPPERMFIRREWALKKILICLEQRGNKRGGGGELMEPQMQQNGPPQLGVLVLGSNGSGKSTICQSILDGGTGTKGILNRRLFCCYLISSQNPECHSISIFIRSLVLQILSHSSYLFRDEEGQRDGEELLETTTTAGVTGEEEEKRDEGKSEGAGSSECGERMATVHSTTTTTGDNSKLSRLTSEKIKELEEMLISELQSAGHGSPLLGGRKSILRQQSEPVAKQRRGEEEDGNKLLKEFGSNPSLLTTTAVGSIKEEEGKRQPGTPKKISKIPVKIGPVTSTRGSPKVSVCQDDEGDGDGEKLRTTEKEEQEVVKEIVKADQLKEETKEEEQPKKDEEEEVEKDEESVSLAAPLPLPKTKDCRTLLADSYYELLMTSPEIMESLSVDCIEKNPDECFKKVILFPLLELNPPKSSLLFLIDSIDEHYITESSLMSTLKKNSGRGGVTGAVAASSKSQNIAELLAQHVHLLPKWLFLVCTGKKQNKHITKLFSGFKKITIDDLRKSHVVKDVQEYIILRLNTDFRNAINLTKDVIDSLNQLYLKSNGCVLYLQKVMDGIKEGFFTFREIRLLPCSLNGLYLYICQKSFNKKQFHKIRPILNTLLAVPQAFVDKEFVFNCLRTQNYTIDSAEFEQRLALMRNVLVFDTCGEKLRIFHNSFADWLIDVKFSTKKFLCDVNEGHVMIGMYYALISERLCANMVRRFIYHLIKAGEYLQSRGQPLDLIVFVLETKANLSDCFYTNSLSCCRSCELDAKAELNLNLPRTRQMLSNYIDKALKNEQLQEFLGDFFKPNLPTDAKSLKLLIETGINNADQQVSGNQFWEGEGEMTEMMSDADGDSVKRSIKSNMSFIASSIVDVDTQNTGEGTGECRKQKLVDH